MYEDKFRTLIGLGSGGIFALTVVIMLGLDANKFLITLFLILTLISALFIPKAGYSALTIFALGSLIFYIDTIGKSNPSYNDMGWCIFFFIITLIVTIFRNYLESS